LGISLSNDELNKRHRTLESYLVTVVDRKDTRNSKAIKSFLELHQFAPEIIYQTPQLLGVLKYTKSKYVSHCEFLAKINVFVITIYDKPNKSSAFEIYNFKQTGIVSDKFLLRSPSEKMDEFSGRMSMMGVTGNEMG
jgi:hypothetical protein